MAPLVRTGGSRHTGLAALPHRNIQETKEWYDGYRFGNVDIYCPWDVINYVDRIKDDPGARPEAFWINTSGNFQIRRSCNSSGKRLKKEIRKE